MTTCMANFEHGTPCGRASVLSVLDACGYQVHYCEKCGGIQR